MSDSGDESYLSFWATLGAIARGLLFFVPGVLLSLPITIPWSKHYWAGDGQAVLGGMMVSVYIGIISAVGGCIYMIQRAGAKSDRSGK
jgi:hypothetical protein